MRLLIVAVAALVHGCVLGAGIDYVDGALGQSAALIDAMGGNAAAVFGWLLVLAMLGMGWMVPLGAALAGGATALASRASSRGKAPGIAICIVLVALTALAGWHIGMQLQPRPTSTVATYGTTYSVLWWLTAVMHWSVTSFAIWFAAAPRQLPSFAPAHP